MNEQLNILHLEDSLLDAEIIQSKIANEGIDYNIVVVKDRESYYEQIVSKKYNLILCDYSIPSYSGIEALTLAKNILPEVPFIFCSGTIGEERAVDALKLGATDYILKDRLSRLCPAIKRAINETKEKNERKHVEEELVKSEERFRLIMQAANDAIWDFDVAENKIWWSEGFKVLFGYRDVEHFSSQDVWAHIIHQEDLASFRSSLEDNVKAKHNSWSGEYRVKRADNTFAFVFCRSFIVYDENFNPKRIVGSIMDITERKETLENLVKAKEKAEESDKLKTEFLAQISHEIRTPLNAIMSFVSLLGSRIEEIMDADIYIMLNGIDNAGKRLIRTVELILNMSSIQTGGYDADFKKIKIKPLIEGLVNEFSSVCVYKDLEIGWLFETDIEYVLCDEYSIVHMLQNLINNAIKYTEKGKVLIRLYKNEENKISIDVKDTGIGISEEYVPNLFKPFSQEYTGYSRKFEGNGLGLALTKKYGEINKTDIKVKSIKGVGSTFTIVFNQEELKK
jgi:PAS domain S-box-containing protein